MIDELSISTVRIELEKISAAGSKNLCLAIGTGFFWKSDNETFFITNLHNVTGRHFETGEPLNKVYSSAIPDNIHGHFHTCSESGAVNVQFFDLAIYNVDETPCWIQ